MTLLMLGWSVFVVGTLIVFAGMWWIRKEIKAGGSVTYAVMCSNLFYCLAILGTLIIGYSPFHLLWIFPLAFLLGFLTLAFPFSEVLIPLARLYGQICCLGLDNEEIERNKARVHRVRELTERGMPREEAVKRVTQEDSQSREI